MIDLIPQLKLRALPLSAAAGALTLAGSLPALAFAPAHADSPGAPLPISVNHRQVAYGGQVLASGRLPASDAAREIALQYAPAGGPFAPVATGHVRSDGVYRLTARLQRSGAVRVTLPARAQQASQGSAGATAAGASRPQSVAVAAAVAARPRTLDTLSGHSVPVVGYLRPAGGGRTVALEGYDRGHWRYVARARTQRNGRFVIHLRGRGPGTTKLRYRFYGDRANAATARRAGTLNVYRSALASWYDVGGGAVACPGGVPANGMGVANKTLPCGTKVTLRYNGRRVTVPVIDRGPYVGGRDWDLTGPAARALGFDGVGAIWSTR